MHTYILISFQINLKFLNEDKSYMISNFKYIFCNKNCLPNTKLLRGYRQFHGKSLTFTLWTGDAGKMEAIFTDDQNRAGRPILLSILLVILFMTMCDARHYLKESVLLITSLRCLFTKCSRVMKSNIVLWRRGYVFPYYSSLKWASYNGNILMW